MSGFALVVGGSGGLGAACARALAADGQSVVVTYRSNRDAAERVVASIRAEGGEADVRPLALPDGDPGSLDGLRTLVFAAGMEIGQPYISRTEASDLATALRVEVEGFFAVARAALPHLRRQQGSVP